MGAFSLLLLLALAVSEIVHAKPVAELSIFLFGFFGLGSAPLQLIPEIRGTRFFVMSVGLGIAIVLLTGFALVELRVWWLGRPLFIAFAIVAGILHSSNLNSRSFYILRNILQVQRQRTGLPSWGSRSVITMSLGGGFICIFCGVRDQHLIPKIGGLPVSIYPEWFIGLALLVIAFAVAWVSCPSALWLPTVLFALVFTVTPSIVYDLARYDWTQSHVGLTLYFLQHGQTTSSQSSIYQSWPGFFAGFAWLCHAGSVANVEALARWWPPVVDVVGAIVVQYVARIIGVSTRNAWLSAGLFIAGNTIAQDYYSPQAMSYLAFLIILAIVLRPQNESDRVRDRPNRSVVLSDWFLLIALTFANAVSHPLTPLVTCGMLLLLALFGVLKSRWMALIPIVPAVLWDILHWSSVSQFFSIGQIGNVGANLATPSTAEHLHYGIYPHIAIAGQGLAPVIVGVLALISLLSLRDRMSWALATCAASTGALLVTVHYGNEDLFRATLFALPFLAILAGRLEWRRSQLYSAIVVAILPLITAAYLTGDMGFDYIYVVRPSDLSTVSYFERTAPQYSTLYSISDGAYTPVGSTARSNEFYFQSYDLPQYRTLTLGEINANARYFTESVIKTAANGKTPVYAVTLQQAAAEWDEGGLLSLQSYRQFASALSHLKQWRVVKQTSTSTLLELRIDS
jgi:hypothetical protein